MAASGEADGGVYEIRQKVFKLLGEAFHIYDASGEVVGYCKQKAFRFREAFVFYTDESCAERLFEVNTKQVIDFGATYEVTLSGGGVLGSLRRKGLKSLVRDSWELFDAEGGLAATLREDSMRMAVLRRFVGLVNFFSPQVLHLREPSGGDLATFTKRFNPLVHTMGVRIEDTSAEVDDLLILAAGCVYMAIDARQGD